LSPITDTKKRLFACQTLLQEGDLATCGMVGKPVSNRVWRTHYDHEVGAVEIVCIPSFFTEVSGYEMATRVSPLLKQAQFMSNGKVGEHRYRFHFSPLWVALSI
jgi:hypothetical protein